MQLASKNPLQNNPFPFFFLLNKEVLLLWKGDTQSPLWKAAWLTTELFVCLSVYTHYIPSEPLSHGCTLSTALALATLPFPLSAPQPCHCTKSAPVTQFTASRVFPHFELCKGFRGLKPTRNQRAPKAALLHEARCANADLLFRNSSWTISCYLEGELLAPGRCWEGCEPSLAYQAENVTFRKVMQTAFSLGWTRRRVRTSTARDRKFHEDNCPANPKRWKWWQKTGHFSLTPFFVEMGRVPSLSESYTKA